MSNADKNEILEALLILENKIDARFNAIDATLNNIHTRLSSVERDIFDIKENIKKI